MRLNEKGLRDALANLAELEQRARILERQAVADAERAELQLNAYRSLLGHVAHFRAEYRAQLDDIELQKQAGG